MTKDLSQITPAMIKQKLEKVEDPELGVNIVELGFIYDVNVEANQIKIKMSLTTPGCPMSRFIQKQMVSVLSSLVDNPEEQIEIKLVFEPQWTPERMSDSAKQELGWED